MLLELSDNIRIIIGIVLGLAISFILFQPLFKIAKSKGFVKKINIRSSHEQEVPDFGGMLIFASLFFSFTALITFPHKEMQYILLGTCILWAVGLYDDVISLKHKYKLIGELVSAIIIVIGGCLYYSSFHGVLGIYEIPTSIGVIFSIFMMTGIINAINMIDGIDGLCSGISILILSAFTTWFYMNGYTNYAIIGSTAIAGTIPFFYKNMFCKKEKIFLGDNGSLVLGVLISVLAIKFNELSLNNNVWNNTSSAPGVAFCFLAIPVMDTIRLMTVRLLQMRSPFLPDKEHIHHKLLIIFNNSHKKSTFVLLSMQLFFIILAIACSQMSNEILIILAGCLYAIAYWYIYKLARSKTLIKHNIINENKINRGGLSTVLTIQDSKENKID